MNKKEQISEFISKAKLLGLTKILITQSEKEAFLFKSESTLMPIAIKEKLIHDGVQKLFTQDGVQVYILSSDMEEKLLKTQIVV